MSDEKTRVLGRNAAGAAEPRIIDGQIVFFCPAGHRLVVPTELAGKRGKCSKCSLPIQIPDLRGGEAASGAEAAPAVAPHPAAAVAPPPPPPATPASPVAADLAAAPEASADGDWNFISGIAGTPAAPGLAAGSSSWGQNIPPDANPMARLLARLWEERDHGGIVELHLAGGAVILPEEFSPRWSGSSHGVFASQAADGSVTLTAVAWDTVQRIVVRQLAAVPGDMFE
ncbi:MAG: hypothetical protein ACKO40_11925 [Planctomycetaceae bacterium]